MKNALLQCHVVNDNQASPESARHCSIGGELPPDYTIVAPSVGRGFSAKEAAFPASGSKWISPHTLAKRWGVSRETVLRMIRSGELPVHRVNTRVYRIAEADAAAVAARRYGNMPQLATSRAVGELTV